MTSSERFCQNLLNMRTKAKMSQDEFAACCGIPPAYYSKLERMISSPTLGMADKVCANLHVSLADTVGKEMDAPKMDMEDLLVMGLLKKVNPKDKELYVGILKLYARSERKKEHK